MIETPALPLAIVDGACLDEPVRGVLRPGETVSEGGGLPRRLPRYFYEVPSWEVALRTRLSTHFGLWELIDVDVREAALARTFPRYVPCAVTLLAAHLQVLRSELGRVVRVAANGGYRSPSHQLSGSTSTHAWGTAANLYRIGEEWLDSRERIERHRALARTALPGVWIRPYGEEPGGAFDHLHLDLGYLTVEPHASALAPRDPERPRRPEER